MVQELENIDLRISHSILNSNWSSGIREGILQVLRSHDQKNLRGYHALQGDNSLQSVERFDHMSKYHKSMSKDKKFTARIQKCKEKPQLFDLEI